MALPFILILQIWNVLVVPGHPVYLLHLFVSVLDFGETTLPQCEKIALALQDDIALKNPAKKRGCYNPSYPV
jgi:hypothetical protein